MEYASCPNLVLTLILIFASNFVRLKKSLPMGRDHNKSVIVVCRDVEGRPRAYYLQKEGHAVTVLDKAGMDSGASYVNAGYLTPIHIIPFAAPGKINQGLKYMFDSTSPFFMRPRLDTDFLRWAWYFKKSSTLAKVERAMPVIRDINLMSRELYDALKASGDLGDFQLGDKGLLMVYKTDKARDHEMAVMERAVEMGLEARSLDKAQLADIEPQVDFDAQGAILYECDRHTTPPQIMKALEGFLTAHGAVIKKGEEVLDLVAQGGKIREIKTDKGTYSADEVVLSAGSW